MLARVGETSIGNMGGGHAVLSRAVFVQTLFHDDLETLKGSGMRERGQGE